MTDELTAALERARKGLQKMVCRPGVTDAEAEIMRALHSMIDMCEALHIQAELQWRATVTRRIER